MKPGKLFPQAFVFRLVCAQDIIFGSVTIHGDEVEDSASFIGGTQGSWKA